MPRRREWKFFIFFILYFFTFNYLWANCASTERFLRLEDGGGGGGGGWGGEREREQKLCLVTESTLFGGFPIKFI